MSNQALGYIQKLAFRLRGSTGTTSSLPTDGWPSVLGTPTPQDLGAYSLLPALSEGISDNETHLQDDVLDGSAGVSILDLTSRLPSGPVELGARYSTLEQIFAAALGFEKPRSTTVLESPAVTSLVTSTATGGTITTLVKTAAGWTPNAYEGAFVRMEKVSASPNAVFEVRRIVSNDATTLTVTPAFTTAPVNTDPFTIFRVATHTIECAKNMHAERLADLMSLPYDTTKWLTREGVLGISRSPVGVWEYQAAMINKLKVKLSPKDGLTISAEFVMYGYDIRTSSRNSSAATWTHNPLLALTSIGGSGAQTARQLRRVQFKDFVIRLGTYNTSALGATDILGVSELEFEIDNGLATEDQDTKNGIYRIEPVRSKKRIVKGKITLPRFNDSARIAALRAETAQKMDIVSTGPNMFLAGPPGTHSLEFYFPKIKLMAPSVSVPGPAPLTEVLEFQALAPELVVSGMPTPSAGADNSEVFVKTVSLYPFNDFMGQQTTT
ncbi:MAG: hypothetical protein IPK72_21125 [Candidatus Eisenbacteria bacterium]|nr:hypothetical protein [Candidatus Eisenbacteria bacterium]